MVEDLMYRQYFLKPPYHGNYWIGATTGKGKSREWYWLDKTVMWNNETGYQAWGKLTGLTPLSEPNNLAGNENCAIGNWTMRYGTPSVFGWADQPCDMKLPAMCKVRRECQGWAPAHGSAAMCPGTCTFACSARSTAPAGSPWWAAMWH